MRLSRFAVLTFSLLLALQSTGCTDSSSTIGKPYYPDSVQFQTVVRQDTNFIKLASVSAPTFYSLGRVFNITWSSPVMLIGRSKIGTDDIQSWGVLRFPSLPADSAQHLTKVRLLLKDVNYKFGDTTNSVVNLNVYNVEGDGKITDSTTRLPSFVLSQTPIGTISNPAFLDSTNNQIAIDIVPAIYPDLVASSFTYVVTPGAGMSNVRGFGTSDLTDTNGVPRVEYTFTYGSTITTTYARPTFDMHIAEDNSVTPPQEFTLRGSVGLREFVNFNFNAPNDTLKLDPFSTINNAVLALRLDPDNSRRSNQSFDTAGPVVVQQIGVSDTNAVYFANGVRDASDPTLYRFQVRTLLEFWLRNPTKNFGLELRAGFSGRRFITSSVGVEDNTLNRWSFYGSNAVDPKNRPQLILSYSKIK